MDAHIAGHVFLLGQDSFEAVEGNLEGLDVMVEAFGIGWLAFEKATRSISICL